MVFSNDTVAAIATPPGQGGIAILRISGTAAKIVLACLFKPAKDLSGGVFDFIPRHMHYGNAIDAHGDVLDEVLAVFMPGPHSATGEDVAEIHCHGGSGVTTALLEAAVEAGARIAGPGEFTRRAFLNGRIDLSQAEAVAELVSAPTREGARLAVAKLEGALGREVRAVRDALDALRLQVALCVDFPDEDAELLSHASFSRTVRECIAAVELLLSGFERAKLWREGALAVLAGRVNAGKSSLLNAMLGRERAIVSAQPGTTRDYIEESINIKGIPLRLVDTAGLRDGGDLVEEEGIRRSRTLAEEADIVVFVTDVNADVEIDELDFLSRNLDRIWQGRLLIVLNKVDECPADEDSVSTSIPSGIPLEEPEVSHSSMLGTFASDEERVGAMTRGRALLSAAGAYAPLPDGSKLSDAFCDALCLPVSAKTGQGLPALEEALKKALVSITGADVSVKGDIAPNVRQAGLLRAALTDLEALLHALEGAMPADILGVHLEGAAASLAGVTGSAGTEELLDSIFSSFCIGK